MSEVYFTSDSHIGHRNIIKYCQRPFSSIEHMNQEIIKRWNSVVKDEDTVYHLGDVAFTKRGEWQWMIQSLKGHKILISGNHDNHTNKSYYDAGFEKIHQEWNLEYWPGMGRPHHILLKHKPQFDYDQEKHNYHFCGHIHTRWTRKGDIINVGVDKWDFTPRTFMELIQAKEDYPVHDIYASIKDQVKGYYETKPS